MSGLLSETAQVEEADWMSEVKKDYQIDNNSVASFLDRPVSERYRELDFQSTNGSFVVDDQKVAEEGLRHVLEEDSDKAHPYKLPVAVTPPDGNTAYFSKTVSEKPCTVFFLKRNSCTKFTVPIK